MQSGELVEQRIDRAGQQIRPIIVGVFADKLSRLPKTTPLRPIWDRAGPSLAAVLRRRLAGQSHAAASSGRPIPTQVGSSPRQRKFVQAEACEYRSASILPGEGPPASEGNWQFLECHQASRRYSISQAGSYREARNDSNNRENPTGELSIVAARIGMLQIIGWIRSDDCGDRENEAQHLPAPPNKSIHAAIPAPSSFNSRKYLNSFDPKLNHGIHSDGSLFQRVDEGTCGHVDNLESIIN